MKTKKEDIQAALILCIPLIVFLVLLILRQTGLVSASWWLVTAPLWIPLAAAVLVGLVTVGILTYRIHKR